MGCFVIFVLAWCWFNATQSKPHKVVKHLKENLNISKTFIILILLFGSRIGHGQIEIRGTVISEITKETPWYDYTIKPNILEHPTSFPDEKGNFLIEFLEPNKEYEIIISSIGYEDQKFNVKTNDGITYKTFELKVDCFYSGEKAEVDWKNGNAQFLLNGSIAPIANTKADNRFEKKYNIEYYDFGCMITNYECIILYNKKMAELMDERFGQKWRKEARKGIIGI